MDLSQIFANSQAYKSENPFLDYLRLTPSGTGTALQVDPDGDLGSRGWRTLAILEEIAPLALSSSSFII